MRLIYDDEALDAIDNRIRQIGYEDFVLVLSIRQAVRGVKPVDAVPVVRCGDCIRYRPDDDVWGRCTIMPYRMRKNDYCSYGVIDDMRKDGDQHD